MHGIHGPARRGWVSLLAAVVRPRTQRASTPTTPKITATAARSDERHRPNSKDTRMVQDSQPYILVYSGSPLQGRRRSPLPSFPLLFPGPALSFTPSFTPAFHRALTRGDAHFDPGPRDSRFSGPFQHSAQQSPPGIFEPSPCRRRRNSVASMESSKGRLSALGSVWQAVRVPG
jgi:hypothetical protein